MRSFQYGSIPLILLFALGCGDGKSQIKAKGRITQGGQPYVAEEDASFRIFFVPLEPQSETKHDSYAAEYHRDDSTFLVMGKDGKGLPAGKYRVDLQLIKKKADLLKGKLMGAKSPFTCEVNNGSEEVEIDLDQAKLNLK
jgi:hypothetical protein